MIRTEKQMWNYMRAPLKSYGTHFTRIESGETSLGQPDLNFCVNGVDGNIELKISATLNRKITLRPAQHRWFKSRINAGSTSSWVMAYITKEKIWLLIRGDYTKELISNPKAYDWVKLAEHKFVDKLDYDKLIEILGGTYVK